jgi:hypothetical protein
MPVKPPIVNKNKNPNAYNVSVFIVIVPPQTVANQLKILIPVGTAIIIVAAMKYALVSISNPTVYI